MKLSFSESKPPGIIVASPVGEVDLYSAGEFASATLARMKESLRAVIVDLSGVDYLDSSGTGAILRILHRARTLGGRLLLAGAKKGPRQVLEMVNIFSLIKAFATAEDAVADAARPRESQR